MLNGNLWSISQQKSISDPQVPKVKVNLYYESFCPGCRAFITKQLGPNFEEFGQYLDIQLNPFGNARMVGPDPKTGTVDWSLNLAPFVKTCCLWCFGSDRTEKDKCFKVDGKQFCLRAIWIGYVSSVDFHLNTNKRESWLTFVNELLLRECTSQHLWYTVGFVL